jgi:Zn2+/Cd2+-exporting ATPase
LLSQCKSIFKRITSSPFFSSSSSQQNKKEVDDFATSTNEMIRTRFIPCMHYRVYLSKTQSLAFRNITGATYHVLKTNSRNTSRIILRSRNLSTTAVDEKPKDAKLPPSLHMLRKITDRIGTNIPIAITSIGAATAPVLFDIPPDISQALLFGVYIGVGIPSVLHHILEAYGSRENALKSLLDVHTLMTLSAFSALALDKGAEGAFLLGLFQLAHAVEHHTVSRAEKDVNKLATLVPDEAQVVVQDSDGGEAQVQNTRCTEVPIGSVILVRPHAVCPIDGVLISEFASVNVAHITGESASVTKRRGKTIPAGAVNASSQAIQIRTTKTANQSALQRIVALAQSAAHSRPNIASLFDMYAPFYTAGVLATTAGIGLSSTLLLGTPVGEAFYSALSFLVAASPCALLVASPVAQAAAVSACSRRGIVLSGGVAALERFSRARTLALDKTGTITQGQMNVTAVHMLKGRDLSAGGRDELLLFRLASALAQHGSRHPVSQAIAREGQVRSQQSPGTLVEGEFLLAVDSVEELPGRGVKGVVRQASLGVDWTVTIGRHFGDTALTSSLPAMEGSVTVIHASPQGGEDPALSELQCVVSMTDTIREGVKESLRACSLPVVMLTGDNRATALAIGDAVGIPSSAVFSQLTPEDKAAKVASLDEVLMVGDGINDAPALAAAPAGGIAVASPSGGDTIQSAAVSVADAVILCTENGSSTNPVEAVNFLVSKSMQTQTIVKQNIGIALVSIVGTAGMVVVHGCPLWMAVLFHEGSTVLVVLNGLRNLYP